MTYKELDTIIYNTFSSVDGVEQVIRNSNKINDKKTKYPCIAYDFSTATRDEMTTTYSFNVYACEKMTDSDAVSVENHSKLMDMLNKVVDKLIYADDITLSLPISINANSVKFADVLDVVLYTLYITVDNTPYCDD